MNKRSIWYYGSLVVMLLTIYLLITGSSILTRPLYSNSTVPFGTIITWAGIIALPLSIYWGINNLRNPSSSFHKYLTACLKLLFVLAILWVPICYLLSGNLSFSFTETDTFRGGQSAMRWFWIISYATAIGPILLLITYWLSTVFKK